MPVYDFIIDMSGRPSVPAGQHATPSQYPPAMAQTSHAKGGRSRIMSGGPLVDPTDIEEFLIPGFHALDSAMKMYWSDIRVPTRDSYRFCRIKIAGGEKSLLLWRDDLLNGRVRLPVGSLNRTKVEFNKDRFSPPYHPMVIRYPTKRGDLAALVYRPVPWLVSYTLSVWSEHKRDAEFIAYQTVNRFNPLAVFRMSDGHIQGDVTLRFGGWNDQSEKEVPADQNRLIKYEYAMTAEAWLPLPERLVPTVLGHVVSVKDDLSNSLLSILGRRGF